MYEALCVFVCTGCFSACQQLKWYMAEAAFLPPSECQPAVHVHAMQEPDTPNTRRSWSVTVWALPKSFWLFTDPQQHPEDWKTKQKALQLPYFFFYLLKISFPFLTVYICNELTLKRTNVWHSLLFSNKQDFSYCRIKVITRQMICSVSPLQEMTC